MKITHIKIYANYTMSTKCMKCQKFFANGVDYFANRSSQTRDAFYIVRPVAYQA